MSPGFRLFNYRQSDRRNVLQLMTSSVTRVVCTTPPPVPVIVIVRVPVLVRPDTRTVMVEVPEPGAEIEVGLKLTATLLPWPEADSEIAELNPPEMAVVILEIPELPRTTVMEAGEAVMVKFGVVPVTVSDTVVVSIVVPEVPVTVMG